MNQGKFRELGTDIMLLETISLSRSIQLYGFIDTKTTDF